MQFNDRPSARPTNGRYFDRIQNSMKIGNALVPNLMADHNSFLRVMQRVQNFAVIGWTDF